MTHRHDYELVAAVADGASVIGHEVCTRCGESRSAPLDRRAFVARLIDKAKKLLVRGARGRQRSLFA